MDMKRFFLYAIMIAALALAGCGGGSSTTPAVDPGALPPPPMNPVDLGMLLTGYTTVTPGTYEIAAGMTMDVGHATFACASGGDDCSVTVADDGTTATSTGGMATAMPSMQARADKKTADDEAAKAEKARLAKAMGIAMAINDPTDAASDNGLPNSVTIKRGTGRAEDMTGGVAVVTPMNSGAGEEDADVAFSPKYEKAAHVGADLSGDGWYGQTLMRAGKSMSDPDDELIVYTDIKAATPQKLKYNNDDANANDNIPNPNVIDQSLAIVLASDTTAYTGSDTDDDMDQGVTGRLGTVPGRFTCTTGACTVTFAPTGPNVAANTVAAFVGTGWTFESAAYVEAQATPDGDYMYFGYWVQVPAEGNKHAFNTFFGGNNPFTVPTALMAAGETDSDDMIADDKHWSYMDSKATYNGSAAGKYADKDLSVMSGALHVDNVRAGHFEAMATLTAYFGQSKEVPEVKHNTISGSVTDFKDSATGADLNFRVNLKTADITNAMTVMGTADGLHGTTQSTRGSWNGMFFGPQENETASTTDNEGNLLPGGIAGEFDAHFSDAHVGGAFGAK